jgi:hypothetical protein
VAVPFLWKIFRQLDIDEYITLYQWESKHQKWERLLDVCADLTLLFHALSDRSYTGAGPLLEKHDTETLNECIGSWNVSNVSNMSRMFECANSFNQDIGSKDVSRATDMYQMFTTSSINQNTGSWDASRVTNMTAMSSGSSLFNQGIGSWNVSSAEKVEQMFMITSILTKTLKIGMCQR